MARYTFISNQYVKSLTKSNCISNQEAETIFQSIPTVASELNEASEKLSRKKMSLENFNKLYGHLRPGTYDITSLPYHKSKDYFKNNGNRKAPEKINTKKSINNEIMTKLSKSLKGFEIKISPKKFIKFITISTQSENHLNLSLLKIYR